MSLDYSVFNMVNYGATRAIGIDINRCFRYVAFLQYQLCLRC